MEITCGLLGSTNFLAAILPFFDLLSRLADCLLQSLLQIQFPLGTNLRRDSSLKDASRAQGSGHCQSEHQLSLQFIVCDASPLQGLSA